MKINKESLERILTDLRQPTIPLCNVGDDGIDRDDIIVMVELLIELLGDK